MYVILNFMTQNEATKRFKVISPAEGLKLAKNVKQRLLTAKMPVQKFYLFGSVLKGEATADSDIDMAVVVQPFLDDEYQETIAVLQEARKEDVRIEIICLRETAMQNRYSTLVKTLQTEALVVE